MRGVIESGDDLTQSLADLHIAFLMHKLMHEHKDELDSFHQSVVDEYEDMVTSNMEQYLREAKFYHKENDSALFVFNHGTGNGTSKISGDDTDIAT